jgi:hypothetical protein
MAEVTNQSGAVPFNDQKAAREYLLSLNFDDSELDDKQVTAVAMMMNRMVTDKANLAPITPPPASREQLNEYMAKAQRDLGPYMADQLNTFRTEIERNIGDVTGAADIASQQREETIRQERETLANQMAEAGTQFGSLRKNAEARLKTRQGLIVRSEASGVAQQLRDQASQFEKTYGPQELAKLRIPELTYAGVKVQPYQPIGVQEGFGSQQALNSGALQQRVQTQDTARRSGVGAIMGTS